MATEPVTNGYGHQVNGNGSGDVKVSVNDQHDFTVKTGLAQMLKGGVIMDVVNAQQVPLPIKSCFMLCLCPRPNASLIILSTRLSSPKRPALWLSWRSKECLQTSAPREVLSGCRTQS